MVNVVATPSRTNCGASHHTLIGTATPGSSRRPASLAARSRAASTSAATAMARHAVTMPVPTRRSVVIPEGCLVTRLASGTRARS
ncbi:Os01g0871733 [Oryza sativa Japonica Group]|uniref:Os01g0871733 protein n=1 Tax=Oryza sativa subsp. japonica TaxID=39947 RepID=A0A0P0VAZ7_ORYSJ|nr:hypothetical protein EE612_007079 [Oryza sativa]BAS75454.1 Os01g0871733 [Oryza sativa Japonica Group]